MARDAVVHLTGVEARGTVGSLRVQTRNTVDALSKALCRSDELGAVIRAHLFVEHEVNEFIGARMPAGAFEALDLEYSAKVKLALALGLDRSFKGPLNSLGNM